MNTDKQLIQQQIEATFKRRVEALYITPKTVKFLREQAAFFAGAMAALQSVFGEQTDSGQLTDMVPVTWTIDIMRNANIVRDKPKPTPPKDPLLVTHSGFTPPIPGDWVVSSVGSTWCILNLRTGRRKKVGAVVRARSRSKVNYFDRAMALASERNRAEQSKLQKSN